MSSTLVEASRYPFRWCIVKSQTPTGGVELVVEVEPDAEECEVLIDLDESLLIDIMNQLGFSVVKR
jgi:hypothetical protein